MPDPRGAGPRPPPRSSGVGEAASALRARWSPRGLDPHPRAWMADALTLARLPLIVVGYVLTYAHLRTPFVIIALVIVLTDILDGPVARTVRGARAAGQSLEKAAARDPREARGANLDSFADFCFFASLVVWGYLWRGPELAPLAGVVAVFFVLYVAANLLSFSLRGIIGHHNRLSRLIATYGTLFALWTILWGLNQVLYDVLLVILAADLAQRVFAIVRAMMTKRRHATVAERAARRTERAKRDEVERAER
ncbi:MAG: CDP-alcohol phosphatidyltransferase family protein [Thermoplasmatota archaeon]